MWLRITGLPSNRFGALSNSCSQAAEEANPRSLSVPYSCYALFRRALSSDMTADPTMKSWKVILLQAGTGTGVLARRQSLCQAAK